MPSAPTSGVGRASLPPSAAWARRRRKRQASGPLARLAGLAACAAAAAALSCGGGGSRRERRGALALAPAGGGGGAAVAAAADDVIREGLGCVGEPSGRAAPGCAGPPDVVVNASWEEADHDAHRRVRLLAPRRGGAGPSVRLLLPRRPEDAALLAQLPPEHLRVHICALRSPRPQLHVDILTDAVSIQRTQESKPYFRLLRPLLPRRPWLLLLSARVDLPDGAVLLGCRHDWVWASVDGGAPEAPQSKMERALQLTFPRHHRLVLWPRRGGRFGGGDGHVKEPGIRGWIRTTFMVFLLVVSFAQVVLLTLCITMLLAQMGLPRMWPAPRLRAGT